MAVKPRGCERCKGPIELERLEVLPETRLCARCAHKVDKLYGGEFDIVHVTRGTGKGGIKITGQEVEGTRKKRKRLPPREE